MIEAIIIIGIGAVFVAVSGFRWAQEQRPTAQLMAQGGNERDLVRGLLFALWATALPAYFLLKWYSLDKPPVNLSEYQYVHRMWSELWAALSVVLGLLFGVKKF